MRFGALLLAGWLAGCTGFSGGPTAQAPPSPAPGNAIGFGQVKAALILPLGTGGHAGQAATAMRNAAELSLAEAGGANIQLIVKDDGGTAPGATAATEAALAEGAEIILGPLFSHSVRAAGQSRGNATCRSSVSPPTAAWRRAAFIS